LHRAWLADYRADVKHTGRVTKTFPVFDCDAHINDPNEIWTTYVAPE